MTAPRPDPTRIVPPDDLSLSEVVLSTPDGARAELRRHGAHVTSWTPAGGEEQLFVSRTSEFRPGVAIRGGVPLIFPQFAGMGPLPKHGFARSLPWELVSAGGGEAVLALQESASTLAVWPHAFRAEYHVQVAGQRLTMTLRVRNTGAQAFTFTAALHTYLRVEDVRAAAVEGLKNIQYADSARGEQESREENDRVTFPGEVDRVYFQTPHLIRLFKGSEKSPDFSSLTVRAEGFTDTVVWNPGPEKGAALADLEPDGYLRFVCIESAAIRPPVHLEPGAGWQATQILIAKD